METRMKRALEQESVNGEKTVHFIPISLSHLLLSALSLSSRASERESEGGSDYQGEEGRGEYESSPPFSNFTSDVQGKILTGALFYL